MGYKKAAEILPAEVIELIQQYVDGVNIYIPRKEEHRQVWGTGTQIREELSYRDRQIFAEYEEGRRVVDLAVRYCLSEKSIQRIIRNMKQNMN